MDEIKKSPDEWSREFKLTVLKRHGWAAPTDPTWYTEITRQEFVQRASFSNLLLDEGMDWVSLFKAFKNGA